MKSFAPLAFALALVAFPAIAQDTTATPTEKVWRQGISLMGDLIYPPDYTHFNYVNPDAPKGGTIRASVPGSFDNFNPINGKGDSVSLAGTVYQSLLGATLDDTSAGYGQVANAIAYPDDYSWAAFRIDPDAKWWDGQPITPEDVVWSFDKSKELSSFYANYYAYVTKAEKTGDDEVTFTFSETGNRELPKIISEFEILPKHWWEGTDANGKPRDISASTLEPPMGSGPYRIESFKAGTSITFRRVEDFWGATKPFGVGTNNFDVMRYEFFENTDVAFTAFMADQIDYWNENRAARWAESYNTPAVKEGRIVRERFTQPLADSGRITGFIYNLRRPQFQDVRVRRALNYAFEFEQLQKVVFYGEYERPSSFFQRTELASSGLPEGKELEILESVRDLVPPEVFTTPYTNPVGTAENRRNNLREAARLLDEAGYVVGANNARTLPDGKPFTIELLLPDPILSPVAENLVTTLGLLGIKVTFIAPDSSQWTQRVTERDYDMLYSGWSQTLSPGNEQLDMWGSGAADTPRTRNHSGIKDAGIDALIDKVIYAPDRETLVAATHALDRVLLAQQIILPTYIPVDDRVAWWNRFGHPDPLPAYSIGLPTIWWWDEVKETATGGAR